MVKGSSMQQEDDFSTVGDDALDMRFSSESIQVFHKSLSDFESALPIRSYDIPVHFSGSFDNKSKNAIQNLVNESFVNAEKHQLRLEHNSPEVSFYTRSSWEAKSGTPLKKNSPLPAARLSEKDGIPIVELIIPEKVTTSEEVIKTVRLLFSKLFGKLFFDEHVLRKSAFKLANDDYGASTFDLKEKAHYIHLVEDFPPVMGRAFEEKGRELQMKGKQRREFGKKVFFEALFNEDPSIDDAMRKVIDTVFQTHLEALTADPDLFFDDLADRFLSANPKTTVILPYDARIFRSLASNRRWTIFHAFEERFQLIINSMEELAECRQYLELAAKSAENDIATLEAWKSTFSERIKTLKKRGFVKPFLIEGAKLSQQQKDALDRFPLWVWQNCKPDSPSAAKSMRSFVIKVTDQYKNSVYQKLFEAALRMYNSLESILNGKYSTISESPDYQRVKTVLAWLDLRKTSLVDMLYTCKVASRFGELASIKTINKKEVLKHFEAGWSYFVSFAMVHQYFLDLKKKSRNTSDRSEPFYKLIEKFVRERIQNQPSFQISGLLLEFYRKRQFKLNRVSALIRNESQILDFFVLNQTDIFRDQSKSSAERIDQYAESLIQWQDKRDEQDIRQEEIDEVRLSASDEK